MHPQEIPLVIRGSAHIIPRRAFSVLLDEATALDNHQPGDPVGPHVEALSHQAARQTLALLAPAAAVAPAAA
jgi:hypothetical protein